MITIEVVKEAFLRGGASWVLGLLCGLSLLSVAIIIERWLFYRKRSCDLPRLARRLGAHLATKDLVGARAALQESKSVAANVAAAGIELANLGAVSADKAMQSAVALERARLERWLAYLGTLGNNAPFIGLFGTVIGIIGAFEALGQSPASQLVTNASQVASQTVMTKIAEALVATAVGILVALPAVAAFNYFQRRIASLLSSTEVLSNLVLAYLSGKDSGD